MIMYATHIQKKLEQLADEFGFALDTKHNMIKNESTFTFINVDTTEISEVVVEYSAEDLPSDPDIIVLQIMAGVLGFFEDYHDTVNETFE